MMKFLLVCNILLQKKGFQLCPFYRAYAAGQAFFTKMTVKIKWFNAKNAIMENKLDFL